MQRRYWQFYWPLALTGLTMLLARQFENATLGRYANAARELAVFAFAASAFALLNASLAFVPQMTAVLARSARARKRCLRLTVAVCCVLTVPLVLAGFTRTGALLLGRLFGIGAAVQVPVTHYLRLVSPLLVVNGLRQYYTGLLIQAKRTGVVTVLNGLMLVIAGAVLLAGLHSGLRAVHTLAASLASWLVHLVLSYVFYRRLYKPATDPELKCLGYGAILSFFWPVALTSLMFALSRPILYSFVARLPESEPAIASLRIAFDFALIFHNPLNQFRHLFVMYGREDALGVRRFMIRVTAVVTVVMITVAATPLSKLVFGELLGAPADIAAMARQVLWAGCLIPLIVTLRNYFHGLAMVGRSTLGMGAGGIGRIAVIYGAALACFSFGVLNHITAAAILTLGFAAEAIVVACLSRFRASPSRQARA